MKAPRIFLAQPVTAPSEPTMPEVKLLTPPLAASPLDLSRALVATVPAAIADTTVSTGAGRLSHAPMSELTVPVSEFYALIVALAPDCTPPITGACRAAPR